MLLEVDVSVRDLMQQMLVHNSAHTLLYFLAELESNLIDAEEFANAANKLLNKEEE